MSIFKTDAKFTALQAEHETAKALLATITHERDGLSCSLVIAHAEIATLKASQADFTNRVNSEATRVLAASGHVPLKITANDDGQGARAMSRSEFQSLTPEAKSAFMRHGGKLSE
jgi:hypothetical protein